MAPLIFWWYHITLACAFHHHATSPSHHHRHRWKKLLQPLSSIPSPVSSNPELAATAQNNAIMPTGESYATLTLLEHMHLLTPNVHGGINNDNDNNNNSGANNNMIDLFVKTLGLGLDTKSVDSINNQSGVIFVNCGASQLHLNDDVDYCQQMETLSKLQSAYSSDANNQPAYEIGLRYNNLSLLKEKLDEAPANLCSYSMLNEGDDREMIRITDVYGRVFVARKSRGNNDANTDHEKPDNEPTISSLCQQKVICNSEADILQYGSDIVQKYGVTSTTTSSQSSLSCQGIDYIEFFVPIKENSNGKETIGKIAQFYDFFFDATTSTVYDGTSHIAIVAFGKIGEDGRSEQSLLFRESSSSRTNNIVNDDDIGTGHHIAIYVGENDDDYEVAVQNCLDGGLLWVNTMFKDRVLDVASAMKDKQFRFKDIIDLETGEVLYSIEHEIRSVEHHLFPGPRK